MGVHGQPPDVVTRRVLSTSPNRAHGIHQRPSLQSSLFCTYPFAQMRLDGALGARAPASPRVTAPPWHSPRHRAVLSTWLPLLRIARHTLVLSRTHDTSPFKNCIEARSLLSPRLSARLRLHSAQPRTHLLCSSIIFLFYILIILHRVNIHSIVLNSSRFFCSPDLSKHAHWTALHIRNSS